MAENFGAFNQVVGLVFDQLYRAFPVAIEVDYEEIAGKLSISVAPYVAPEMVFGLRSKVFDEIVPGVALDEFTDQAVKFLESEGFLQRQDKYYFRLSAKALTLLNAPLPGLEKSAGTQIVEVSKDLGSVAGRQAMSEVIGQVIGAAARGLMGG